MGNDLREMDAATLTILNNPAIIALSQDPRGRAVQRVQLNRDVAKDEYDVGETHVWSGPLHNGDQVVIFFNAANKDIDMAVSLSEVFVMDGAGGKAPQTKQDWAVHDLWADRMSNSDAINIFEATTDIARQEIFQRLQWYNATEIPYAQGLEESDQRLFGKQIGTVKVGERLSAHVPRHAAKVFRLRSTGGAGVKRKNLIKDEL
jgi:alpha-galactosidase